MTEQLPKWIQTRYAKLWNKFKEKGFTLDEAEKVLKNNKGINVFFSDLRKSGWIEVTLDEKDSRKRIYRLKNPLDGIKEMVK